MPEALSKTNRYLFIRADDIGRRWAALRVQWIPDFVVPEVDRAVTFIVDRATRPGADWFQDDPAAAELNGLSRADLIRTLTTRTMQRVRDVRQDPHLFPVIQEEVVPPRLLARARRLFRGSTVREAERAEQERQQAVGEGQRAMRETRRAAMLEAQEADRAAKLEAQEGSHRDLEERRARIKRAIVATDAKLAAARRQEREDAQQDQEARATAERAAAQTLQVEARKLQRLRASWDYRAAPPPPAQPFGVSHAGAEQLVCQWLHHLNVADAAVTQYTGDGGIDIDSAQLIVQVKNYAGSVPVADVRDLAGAASVAKKRAALFTSGSMTRDGAAFAEQASIALVHYDAVSGTLRGLNSLGEQAVARSFAHVQWP